MTPVPDELETTESCPGCQQPLHREVTVIRDDSGEVVRQQIGSVTRCDGGCELVLDWNGDVARAIPR